MLIGSDLKTQQPDHGKYVRKHRIISLARRYHQTPKVIQNDFLVSLKAKEMRTSEYLLYAKTAQ